MLLVALSRRERHGGILLVDLTDTRRDGSPLEHIREAMDLISSVDQRRFRILQRELSKILITWGDGPSFWPFSTACVLPKEYVEKEGTAGLASTIIHEVTHARLWRKGFRYDQEIRRRIESACVREQIRFALRLPEGPQIVSRLEAAFEKEWWSDEQIRDRNARGGRAMRGR